MLLLWSRHTLNNKYIIMNFCFVSMHTLNSILNNTLTPKLTYVKTVFLDVDWSYDIFHWTKLACGFEWACFIFKDGSASTGTGQFDFLPSTYVRCLYKKKMGLWNLICTSYVCCPKLLIDAHRTNTTGLFLKFRNCSVFVNVLHVSCKSERARGKLSSSLSKAETTSFFKNKQQQSKGKQTNKTNPLRS